MQNNQTLSRFKQIKENKKESQSGMKGKKESSITISEERLEYSGEGIKDEK